MGPEEVHLGLLEAADRWSDSPLRRRTCTVLAKHPELAADAVDPSTLAAVPWPWKVSFTLNAAVHALILDGSAPLLAAYAPSAGGTRAIDSGFDAALLDLVATRAADIRELTARPLRAQDPRKVLAVHRVLQEWSAHFDGVAPRHLVSLGCAAGFELLLGDEAFCGEPPDYPTPVKRTGVDLDPTDLRDDDAMTWLVACTDASRPEIEPLVRQARARLGSLEHEIRREDARTTLGSESVLADDQVFAVSHQFLCSVEDPAAMTGAVAAAPQITRWLSVEVATVTESLYSLDVDVPLGTPIATLLDGDLRVLAQTAI